jgi:hypothetical protein
VYFRKTIILIICYFIYGCGDYPSGHKDGYESTGKKSWIVFGRSEYLDGYYVGEAEKFQQDWLAENLTETNQLRLQCPDVFLADPIMFLPIEYKKVGLDTYKIDSH